MAAAKMERDPPSPARKAMPPAARTYERPRGGEARAIADLMPTIGRTAFRRFGFVQSSVVSRWPEIVGAAHAPLIQHVIPEIIERVNRFFGYSAVARVKLRQGEVQAPAAKDSAKPGRTAPPSLKPIPMELGDSLRDIGDPELRTVLESLARSLGDVGRNEDGN